MIIKIIILLKKVIILIKIKPDNNKIFKKNENNDGKYINNINRIYYFNTNFIRLY